MFGRQLVSARALISTLALIEKDHGGPLALRVARDLVVFFKRPGGQSQFSSVLSGQIADADGTLGPLLAWIADNLKPTCALRRWRKRPTWVCAPSLGASSPVRG